MATTSFSSYLLSAQRRYLLLFGFFLLLPFASHYYHHHNLVSGRTMSDDIQEMKRRNGTVLSGAIAGDVSTVRAGYGEGGYYDAVLSEFLGETILRVGLPYRDFPVCPTVHLSFFVGGKGNLDTAFFLTRAGVDVNGYKLPDPTYNEADEGTDIINAAPNGYPPALLFALGLGKPPTNSHAAFISRFYETIGHFINMTSLKEYLALTGNPPLIQIPILSNFFDGTYVLATDLHQNINAADFHGVTPLHVASWFGDVRTVSFLLFGGANRFSADILRRIPLHYAAMRGNLAVIELLLTYNNISTMGDIRGKSESSSSESSNSNSNSNSKKSAKKPVVEIVTSSVNHRDMFGYTPVDLAEVQPPIKPSVAEINKIVKAHGLKDNIHVDTRSKFINRIEKGKVYRRMPFPKEASDTDYTRGGWRFSFGAAERRFQNESAEIDKYSAASSSYSFSSTGEKVGKMSKKLRYLGIDILDCQSEMFYKDYFSREYVLNQRPVVLSNMPLSANAIWAYWRREDFLSVFGKLRVLSGEKLYSNHEQAWNIPSPTRNKVATFVDIHMKTTAPHSPPSESEGSSSKHCLSNINPSSGQSIEESCVGGDPVPVAEVASASTPPMPWVGHVDLSNLTSTPLLANLRPDFLNLCGSKDTEPFRMTIGPQGSGSPIHSHNASWNVLLFGAKKWYLIAPGFGNQSLWNEETDIGVTIRVPSAQEWVDKKAPALRKLGMLHEVYQYPGDIIYVPHNWFHVTINLEDTASITQEICTFRNTNLRMQPLGFALYGGEDPHRGIGTPTYYHLATDRSYANENMNKNKDGFKTILNKIPMF